MCALALPVLSIYSQVAGSSDCVPQDQQTEPEEKTQGWPTYTAGNDGFYDLQWHLLFFILKYPIINWRMMTTGLDWTHSAPFFSIIIITPYYLKRPFIDPFKHAFIRQFRKYSLVSLPCSSWFRTAEQSTYFPTTAADLRLRSNTTALQSSTDSLPCLP